MPHPALRRVAGLTGACLLLSACSTTPSVVRTKESLTPTQIAEMGLVCRTAPPVTSNIPRTICASEQAWAAHERRTRLATEELFAEGRKNPNVGRFNRY